MSGTDPELDRPELLAVDRSLTDYASLTDEGPTPGFPDWVMRSVAAEPLPRRGWSAWLAAQLTVPGPYRLATRAVALTLVLAAGIGSALALEQLGGLMVNVGTPPPIPSVEPLPSVEPSVEPTPVPTPTPTPQPPATPTPTPEENTQEPGPDESGPQPTATP